MKLLEPLNSVLPADPEANWISVSEPPALSPSGMNIVTPPLGKDVTSTPPPVKNKD